VASYVSRFNLTKFLFFFFFFKKSFPMSYANVQLSDNLKNYIKAQFDELSQAEIENKRGHFFKLICDEIDQK